MRAVEVQQRADGDNAGRVDVFMRHIIVSLDMVEIDRLSNARKLVEILKITGEMGIVDDASKVALEMAMVDSIEADERDEETPVGLDNL